MLDLGAGDGSIARGIAERRPGLKISAFDSHPRTQVQFPVELYDGVRLPSIDGAFDWVVLSDVVHHSADAAQLMREASRVARQGLVIKDHLAENPLDTATLLAMDVVGNRRFGVAKGVGYFHRQKWNEMWDALGLKVESFEREVPLYPFPLSVLFGRGLHFVARLRKLR